MKFNTGLDEDGRLGQALGGGGLVVAFEIVAFVVFDELPTIKDELESAAGKI